MENANLSQEYSSQALAEFLDYLSDKGLANKNTSASRKAACNKMLAILDPAEAADLRLIELDEIAKRFNNLKGKAYSPQSLQVYKSRVSTALDDFFRYKDNPANFKGGGSGGYKASNGSKPKQKATKVSGVVDKSTPNLVSNQVLKYAPGIQTVNFPIPLRADCVVQINGLPADLTKNEAAKISAVVQAMISVQEE